MPRCCGDCFNFCKEFKAFALRGNMFDLAIGIVIGTAFTSVVQSLVNDIITPPLGLLIGGVDLVNLTAQMPNFVYKNQPPVHIRYGRFIQQIIYLLFVAFVIFFIMKLVNKLYKLATKKKVDMEKLVVVKEVSDEVKALHEIRDLLAGKMISNQPKQSIIEDL